MAASNLRQRSSSPRGAKQPRANSSRQGTLVAMIYGFGLVLTLIGLYFFSEEIAAVIEWGSRLDPWWQP